MAWRNSVMAESKKNNKKKENEYNKRKYKAWMKIM